MNTGAAVIVFREMLEAALVISIVMAATRGNTGRSRWVGAGIGLGILGALVVALFAGTIANILEGRGQDLFNAVILLTVVVMLGGHNIWMVGHGKKLAIEMKHVGMAVSGGHQPLYALTTVVGLAVLREGSEVVLFLTGMAAGNVHPWGLLSGGLVGLAAGIVIGLTLYRGIVTIPPRYFFQVTSWLILLLAGGMAVGASGFLEQAGVIPSLSPVLWDTSAWLSQSSPIGRFLHTLIGYRDQPSGMQVLFYMATIVTIYRLQVWVSCREKMRSLNLLTTLP